MRAQLPESCASHGDGSLKSGSQQRTIASSTAVSLLAVDPEIGRRLTAEERAAAGRVMLPVHVLTGGQADIGTLLAEASAIGLFVLEGSLLQRLRIDVHLTVRLLGPGDLFMSSKDPRAPLPAQFGWLATAATRLALLDQHVLSATRHWPHITAGLLAHMAQQVERAAVQLAIAHLPRAEERLLATMAQLADRWGQATPDGIIIPLALTHETLGELIGSRRSTVTVAVSHLATQGRLLKHDRGWLLRHQPRDPARLDHEQTLGEP